MEEIGASEEVPKVAVKRTIKRKRRSLKLTKAQRRLFEADPERLVKKIRIRYKKSQREREVYLKAVRKSEDSEQLKYVQVNLKKEIANLKDMDSQEQIQEFIKGKSVDQILRELGFETEEDRIHRVVRQTL